MADKYRRMDLLKTTEEKPEPKNNLKSLPMADLLVKPGSSTAGFTQAEARNRLAQHGPNEIAEKKTNEFLKFLSCFWGPIPWMIEAAVILSVLVRHWADFFIILVLLFSNAIVGFWEEYRRATPSPHSRLSWRWALLIWGFAFAWFLVNDRIKLWAYKIFDQQGIGLLNHLLRRHQKFVPVE